MFILFRNKDKYSLNTTEQHLTWVELKEGKTLLELQLLNWREMKMILAKTMLLRVQVPVLLGLDLVMAALIENCRKVLLLGRKHLVRGNLTSLSSKGNCLIFLSAICREIKRNTSLLMIQLIYKL